MKSITNHQKKIVVSLVLITLIMVAYWQVQRFEFLNYDDDIYVTENDQIKTGLTGQALFNIFNDTHTGHWHPLTMLSHMLDWRLFGNNAGRHHWSNVILHVLNAVLLFLLLNKMTGALWRSALVAALFAIHPINVESVAWVAERKNVLSTFWGLLTLLGYVYYVEKPGWKRYLPVLLCFMLGLLSKPMLVTLPFVFLLLDYWPLKRTLIDSRDQNNISSNLKTEKRPFLVLLREKIPLFVLSVISIIFTFHAARSTGIITYGDVISLSQRISNAIVSYVLYLKKIFWPTDLAVLYPIEYVPAGHVIAAGLFLLIVTGIVLKYWKRYPFIALGWFWYLGTLIPVIGIVQVGVQSMADRYAYIPAVGIFIMMAWGFGLMHVKYQKVLSGVFIIIIVSLTMITYRQVQYWENNETLYRHALEVARPSYIPYKNLGLHYLQKNKAEQAAFNLRKAIEFKKNDPALHNSLGVALLMMNNGDGAERKFREALRFNPDHIRAQNNLGMVLLSRGRDDEAMNHFQKAIILEPTLANAHYHLAIILQKKGMKDKARFHYQESVRLNPEFKNKGIVE